MPDFGIAMGGGVGRWRHRRATGRSGQPASLAPRRARRKCGRQRPSQADSGDGCVEEPTKPKPVERAQPQYTDEARSANVEGVVAVEFTIDGERPSRSTLGSSRGLGHGLDQAALAAAKRWKFNPATKCGKARRVEASLSTCGSSSEIDVCEKPLAIAALVALAILSGPRRGRAQTGAPNETPTRQGEAHASAPKLVQFVEAPYPESEKLAGQTASVILQIAISDKGVVEDAAVVQSPAPAFDAAALEAVKKFVFEPAEIDNKPAPVKITYRYDFVFKEEAAGPVVNFEGDHPRSRDQEAHRRRSR